MLFDPATNKLKVLDKSRENEIFDRLENLSGVSGIDAAWLKKIFRIIIAQSRKIQEKTYENI